MSFDFNEFDSFKKIRFCIFLKKIPIFYIWIHPCGQGEQLNIFFNSQLFWSEGKWWVNKQFCLCFWIMSNSWFYKGFCPVCIVSYVICGTLECVVNCIGCTYVLTMCCVFFTHIQHTIFITARRFWHELNQLRHFI